MWAGRLLVLVIREEAPIMQLLRCESVSMERVSAYTRAEASCGRAGRRRW